MTYSEVAKTASSELLFKAFYEIISAWEEDRKLPPDLDPMDIYQACRLELIHRKLIFYH